LVLLLTAAFAWAEMELIDVYTTYGYYAYKVVGICGDGAPSVAVGPFHYDDAWAHGKMVAALKDGEVIVYTSLGELRKRVASFTVDGDYERIAFDGEKVYLCGQRCAAYFLNGTIAWSAAVTFSGGSWTWLGLYNGRLYVPTHNGIAVLSTRNGALEGFFEASFDQAAFCRDTTALAGPDWVALIRENQVLWNLTAEWSPKVLSFTPDCKYLFVGSVNRVYAIADGIAVDSASDEYFVMAIETCRHEDAYAVIAEYVDLLGGFSGYGRTFIVLKTYLFLPPR